MVKTSKEVLAMKPIKVLKAQKKLLQKLYKEENLTIAERIIVIDKLEEINSITQYTVAINECPYSKTRINKLLTGRLCHWYILMGETGFHIIGNGPKFDRNVVKWGASSGPIYTYVTSGIFGIIFYLYICIKFILFSWDFIRTRFSKKYQNISITKQIFFFILLFLMIRSLVEVSFTYWGVDQLIFLSIFIYYEKYIYKNNLSVEN